MSDKQIKVFSGEARAFNLKRLQLENITLWTDNLNQNIALALVGQHKNTGANRLCFAHITGKDYYPLFMGGKPCTNATHTIQNFTRDHTVLGIKCATNFIHQLPVGEFVARRFRLLDIPEVMYLNKKGLNGGIVSVRANPLDMFACHPKYISNEQNDMFQETTETGTHCEHERNFDMIINPND